MASFNGAGSNDSVGSSAFLRRLKMNSGGAISRPLPGQVVKQSHAPTPEDLIRSGSASNKVSDSGEGSSSSAYNKPTATDISSTRSTAATSSNNTEAGANSGTGGFTSYKISQFQKILAEENVNLDALRKISWNGVPPKFRPDVWQILLGYLPTNKDRREKAIQRKRQEYLDSIPVYFTVCEADRTTQDGEILRQIQVDLPRTSPNTAFFQQEAVQQAMERILYIWSIRHPASGYVQGMNDLLTPLLLVAMQRYVDDPLRCDAAALKAATMSNVEADAYWCLTKLLDDIQDHYTFSQPGLQRMMLRLEDLTHRLDNELYQLFQREGLHFQVFAFRWMNCALLRELPLRALVRLWDTYFAEEQGGFENFHVYVCAVLLKHFKEQLVQLDGFQDLVIFLQNLPTSDWTEEDVEPILSQAFILSTLFDNSPSHLG